MMSFLAVTFEVRLQILIRRQLGVYRLPARDRSLLCGRSTNKMLGMASRSRPWLPASLIALVCLAGCRRSSLVDLPLWRVEIEPDGREARVVQLPYRLTAYDMETHAIVREVMDRNHDGVSDRVITYQGMGGARTEETDTDFDGLVDRWDTFGAAGQRRRSATASLGSRPDRIATYDSGGQLARVEIDANRDGQFDLVQVYEDAKLVRVEIDSDGNGRTDRIQDFHEGFLASEDFDTDEDGAPNLRMTYNRDGKLLKVTIVADAEGPTGTGR